MSHNKCPFCEHVNPVDAKFCNDCGAVLHLVPCPKCGAVNDVSAAACYRCHTGLNASAAGNAALQAPEAHNKTKAPDLPELVMTQAKPAPATVAKSAPAVVAKPAPIAVAKPAPAAVAKPASASVETTATSKAPVNTTSDAAPKTVSKTTTMAAASAASRPSINHRPPLLVISIVIAAFALATYYAYRQRTAVAPRDAAAGASVDTTKSPAAESSTGMIEKNASPPIVPAPAVTAADKGGSAVEKATAAQAVKVAPTMPNSAVAPPPANVLAAPVPRVQPAATSAENGVDAAKSGRRRPTQIIPDKPAAPTTPCTDAIAALGLCTPEPTQRRQ